VLLASDKMLGRPDSEEFPASTCHLKHGFHSIKSPSIFVAADEFLGCRIVVRGSRGETYRLRSDFLNLRTEFEARITP